MAEIYFMRHGETELNTKGILTGRIDTHLTKKGIQDAKEVFQKKEKEFDAIYCSPLIRTQETAKAIMGENTQFIIDDRITEVFSGEWQGKYKNELPQKEYELYKNGQWNPPGGETSEEVDERMQSFIKEMFSTYLRDEKILVITHNAFMRSLKRLFSGNREGKEPKNLEMIKITSQDYKNMTSNQFE